ncbi:hypothetical protein FPV67DRAFT_1745460 [Lyophyllum atratum]|nr:hypothetical protein FPV67DRAFT_1745460 [Lyophyllum atratum]
MSAPLTCDFVPLAAENTGTVIERVDSDRTDESPFGSALTTPIDEDVELFPGIQQRLLAKDLDPHIHGAPVYLGPHGAGLDTQGFLKVTQTEAKLSVGDALKAAPTPSPSLDELSIYDNSKDSLLNAHDSRLRAGSIYSQPNRPLDIPGETPDAQLAEYPFFDPLPGPRSSTASAVAENGPPALDATQKPIPVSSVSPNDKASAETARDLFSVLPFAHKTPSFDDLALANDILSSTLSHFSYRNIVPTLLRVILFLPWCMLAGGAILLFTAHLETVIFGPGFTASPKGIRRFAFFADVASELVSIFVMSVVVFWYMFPTAGLMVVGGVLAQAIYAWHGFELDRRVPLGEDDRQTVYLVWKQYRFADALMGMMSTEKGFFTAGAGNGEVDTEDEKGL